MAAVPKEITLRVTVLCTGVAGRLFGHDFQPRFDERPRGASLEQVFLPPAELRELLTLRVYVQDVCTRCGCVVHRRGTAGAACADPG